MTIRAIEHGDTPEGTLKEMLDRAEHFEHVIVIAMNKDGTQYLSASHASMIQKSFLIAFAQAWLTRWFDSMYEDKK